MDIILIQKIISQLAYPTGFIALCICFAAALRILQYRKYSTFLYFMAFLIFFLSSNSHIANSLSKSLENQYTQTNIKETPKAEAIIVLGGSFSPPKAPRKFGQLTDTSNRFWVASKLYKEKKADLIILSGGNVFNEFYIKPESHYIKEWLVDIGIPENAIIIEDKSRTTYENYLETEKILLEKKIKVAILMTSAIHMPRSMQIFSKSKTQLIAVPSDIITTKKLQPRELRIIPSVDSLALTTKALHEYYGMWKESIKAKF